MTYEWLTLVLLRAPVRVDIVNMGEVRQILLFCQEQWLVDIEKLVTPFSQARWIWLLRGEKMWWSKCRRIFDICINLL